jgi:soluble lytic murein transglycosylase-like protein
MRGIGSTLARLSAARALFAGAALLAGFAAQKANAQTAGGYPPNGADDTALAIPRLAPAGNAGVALPQPLAPSEAARIRRIFALQAGGDIPAALQATAQIDTSYDLGRAMLGHILADRYLGRFSRPGTDELRVWLGMWSDLPDASAIHSLLITRLPAGSAAPPAPMEIAIADTPGGDAAQVPVPEETGPLNPSIDRNPAFDRAVHEAARGSGSYAAARLIARNSSLAPAYAALLRGEAAQILFTLNRDEEAFDTAASAVRGCGKDAPDSCQSVALPAYIAGLAAWRMHRTEQAKSMFEAAWRARISTSAVTAAAGFWAARAHLHLHDPSGYVPWMMRAAVQRNTFYGLLARRALGLALGIRDSERETLGEADIDAVAALPEGLRAFALLQVGQTQRAEAELRQLWPAAQARPTLGRALMLVSARAGLVDLAAQFADLVQAADGRPRDATRFAVPKLRPAGGFTIDPAMVYALARTESNFDTAMVSPAGARGLMQIMPETARFLIYGDTGGVAPRAPLHDPGVNLDLGQRYVAYLSTQEQVDGNLIRLLASYNSGPGNFARWSATVHDNRDPLLFIEAIPVDETRAFVPRVLAYTWIYAARLHLPTPTLDELAAGNWPRYHGPDAPHPQEIAARTH